MPRIWAGLRRVSDRRVDERVVIEFCGSAVLAFASGRFVE
jgi:hypothetical protein